MNATATVLPATPALAPSTGTIPPASAPSSLLRPPPQHMRALERANAVRLARAELKRKVAMDQIDVAAVVLNCPWEAESMAVADLLMSQRRWGQTRCRKLARAGREVNRAPAVRALEATNFFVLATCEEMDKCAWPAGA